MNITGISPHSVYKIKQNGFIASQSPIKNGYPQISEISNYPKAYAISFAGGYSADLRVAINELEKAEQKNDKELIPQRVKLFANQVLKAGNPEKLRLIDIHKKAYEGILQAQSISEIREMYPEFKEILSDADGVSSRCAFARYIRDGQSKLFNNQEDLALQLLKLYWGHGFSLSDIGAGEHHKKQIANLMEKYNIPRLDSHYAHILKFSDERYTERLFAEIMAKKAETAEMRDGCPRFTQHLTEEQRLKISEGLIKYYQLHPERAFIHSERQKKFFRENPAEALIMSVVMKLAWQSNSGNFVRRNMKQFFAEHRLNVTRETVDNFISDSDNLNLMKRFWESHPYSKKRYTEALQSSWTRLKNSEFYDVLKTTADITLFPKALDDEIHQIFQHLTDKQPDWFLSLGAHMAQSKIFKDVSAISPILSYLVTANNGVRHEAFKNSMAEQIRIIHRKYKIPENKFPQIEGVINILDKKVADGWLFSLNEICSLYAMSIKALEKNGMHQEVQNLRIIHNRNYEMFLAQLKRNEKMH